MVDMITSRMKFGEKYPGRFAYRLTFDNWHVPIGCVAETAYLEAAIYTQGGLVFYSLVDRLKAPHDLALELHQLEEHVARPRPG